LRAGGDRCSGGKKEGTAAETSPYGENRGREGAEKNIGRRRGCPLCALGARTPGVVAIKSGFYELDLDQLRRRGSDSSTGKTDRQLPLFSLKGESHQKKKAKGEEREGNLFPVISGRKQRAEK